MGRGGGGGGGGGAQCVVEFGLFGTMRGLTGSSGA